MEKEFLLSIKLDIDQGCPSIEGSVSIVIEDLCGSVTYAIMY